MNNDRRKSIRKVIAMVEDAKDLLESIKEEEEEAFDNMPEGLQMSEKGEAIENSISFLDDAVNDLEESISAMEDAM